MSPSLTTTEAISSANDLLASHAATIARARAAQRKLRRVLPSPPDDVPLLSSRPPSPTESEDGPPVSQKAQNHAQQLQRADLPPAKRARVARYRNYVPEEETIRNDYSQRYVDSGEWPQNWVIGTEPERRFEEYPKQRRLLELKKEAVAQHCVPPSYLPFSDLTSIQPSKFDVILIDPPFSSSFTWDHLQELPVPSLAADQSFVFLWVGSGAGEGLERGREVLAKWGYRRCEDVVWVKTNKTSNRGPGADPPTTSLLTRTKQHCLIGIKGTVRRSTDSWFVHCNVDTDVIIWEGDPNDPMRKPPEMYTLIQNFCLGTRRLEIFGRKSSSFRRGWVTVLGPGQDEGLSLEKAEDRSPMIHVETEDGKLDVTRWDRDEWDTAIQGFANGGKPVVPSTPDIDNLRPKSPVRGGPPRASGMGSENPSMPPGSGGPGRFNPNNNSSRGGGMMPGRNQGMSPPMMGVNNLGMGPMGMGTGVGLGIGGGDMMAWQGGMGVGNLNQGAMAGMGNMGPGGMNSMSAGGMGGAMGNMGAGGMGNMNPGNLHSMNSGAMNSMNPTGMGMGGMGIPMMGGMGQMAMGGGFQNQGGGFAGNAPMFGAGQMGGMGGGMGWSEQGQFGMDGGWDGEPMMGVGNTMPVGNNMGNNMTQGSPMNVGGMNMGARMGPWNSGGGYQ
ncbi:hypothetical protein HGRIS_006963 [Hohenbuehelia grisea]|uniref:MT-A70-domain-containing protein n=1 Tax=Hohenbuehelia grisea TaxID=104357 RepID=A0ABR3JAZ5_9AGAR